MAAATVRFAGPASQRDLARHDRMAGALAEVDESGPWPIVADLAGWEHAAAFGQLRGLTREEDRG